MPKLIPIVEGDGEVSAVPVLLNRLLAEMNCQHIQIATPKNAHGRGNLEKPEGLERFIKYAWKERDCGAILVLMDADKDCPQELAQGFAQRIRALGVVHSVVIVCATQMYEAWFLASLETITGRHSGLPQTLSPPKDVESFGGPKGWLNKQFIAGRAYKETEDQEAMTRLLDIALVKERSRSFRRLWRAGEQAVEAIDTGAKIVTPYAELANTQSEAGTRPKKSKKPGRKKK